MNQAGSEKKCSKNVSYECVLNNYNYDDVSTDQNSVCENCKQGGWSASAYSKHSSNVGSVCNTEHVVGVAEVCSREAKSQLQPGANNSFEQSLLQKAWVYLQSILNTHMSACPRCNPRPPPDDESPSESTTQFFQRTTPSVASLNFMPPCRRTKPTCSRTISPGHNDRQPYQRTFHPCPRAPSPCPRAPPSCPNSECPKTKSSKTSTYHKDCHYSTFDSPSPNAKIPRLKAMPPHPNYKSSLHHSVSQDSLSDSSSNLQSRCLNTESVCPNAKPVSSNSKPVCPHSKTVRSNCKTSIYHSFSNDSLPSSCKESLVQMAKVYLEKLTSDHKIKCPLCAKQCSYYSLEPITSYLRGMLEQAWNYINKSAEQKSSESLRSQSICSKTSNTLTNPGILKLPGSTKSRCSCAASKSKFSKPHVMSFESEGQPRSITCPTCLTRFSCPKPGRLNFAPGLCKHYDDDADEREEPTFLERRSKEEGTHEHKSCNTHGCMHKSQSAQPSFNLSNTSYWSSKSYAKPVLIKSRQIKTPQSVEELKASVTRITDKSSGIFYGYDDVLDLRSTIEYSRPCVQNSVSKELICLTDEATPKLFLNLTMEQKDVGSLPKESNHSREFLDNCKETSSPFSDLEGLTYKEEALCPNQSCSEGSRKSEANHVDIIGEESGSMLRKQLSNKETISKAGHNSTTCIETIQSDRKDCTIQEEDNLTRDPNNYRYYY